MPSNLPIRCKHCGVTKAEGARISRNGSCPDCAEARMRAAIEGAAVAADQAAARRRRDVAVAKRGATPRGVGGARRAQKRAG